MIIYVVKPGDSIFKIAQEFGVDSKQIIETNGLENPDRLVVGQTIVILIPEETYVVKPGDGLGSIAAQFNITPIMLLQNNPQLANQDYLIPGQELVIRYQDNRIGDASIGGYAYPNIDRNVLKKTLPYLSEMSLFTYGFTTDGELVTLDDQEVINIARTYGVAPIMMISNLTEQGTFSSELVHQLLNNPSSQDILIENILINMKTKKYFGLEIDFEFIPPEDRQAYIDFVKKVTTRLNQQDYEVMVALAPKTSGDQKGLLYEAHDYAGLGAVADSVLLMTYEWGYTYGPPQAVAPINKVREVLDYAITVIPDNRIFLGIPNYGYDWTLPYVRGESRARSIGNVEAVNLAAKYNAQILFDEVAMAPYFTYYDENRREHIVWFEDARSIEAKLRLIDEYKLRGGHYWTLMKFFPQSWLVAIALYEIDKIYLAK